MNEDRFWRWVQAALDRRLDPMDDDRIAEALFDHPEWADSFERMRQGIERCAREPKAASNLLAAEGPPEESTAAESTAAESTAAESTAAESTAAESTAADSTATESTAAESTAAESTATEALVGEALDGERPGVLRRLSWIGAAASIAIFALSLNRVKTDAVRVGPLRVADAAVAASVFRVHTLISRTATVRVNEVVEHSQAVRDGRVVSWSSTRSLDPNGAPIRSWAEREVVRSQ